VNRRVVIAVAVAALAATIVPAAGQASVPPTSEPVGPIDLASVCPDPLVLQTDWWPQAEYGGIYGLLGDDYEVDADNKIVSGPLMSQGLPTGIDVEVRAGGPAVAFTSVRSLMYSDDDITLGFGSTDGQILSWSETPVVAVAAPLEINPQIIMWDPATYPEVATITDLRDEGITVLTFEGVAFPPVLVAMGVLDGDQIDPTYDGFPTRFISEEGRVAQQGFVSNEPYTYEFLNDWAAPVAYQLLYDAGYQPYTQTLTARVDLVEDLAACLEAFVPVVQQSTVDYVDDPAAANALIIDVVERYDSEWIYDEGLAEFAGRTIADLGLIGNGSDEVVGNFDAERTETVLQQIRDAGLDVAEDLTAEQLYTNEFVDESIGL
jgi:hypothetical protein